MAKLENIEGVNRMTYGEAISVLIGTRPCIEILENPSPILVDVDRAIDIAIKCIEKQIPKEPYREYDDEGRLDVEECPVCHSIEIRDFHYHYNYCSNCGQSIKW